MDINSDMWKDYLDNQYERQKELPSEERMSQALYLKQYLTDKIKFILTKYACQQKIHEENEKKWHSGYSDF